MKWSWAKAHSAEVQFHSKVPKLTGITGDLRDYRTEVNLTEAVDSVPVNQRDAFAAVLERAPEDDLVAHYAGVILGRRRMKLAECKAAAARFEKAVADLPSARCLVHHHHAMASYLESELEPSARRCRSALVESRQHAWLALSKHPDHDGIANSFARTVIRSGKFWALSNDPKRRRETMDFALRSLVKCIRARGKDDLLVKPKSTLSRAQLLGMIGEDPAAAREYAHEALARAEVHDVPRKQEYELALMEIEQRRRIGQLAEEVGDLVDRNLEPRLRDIQRDSLQLLGLLATVVALVAATAGFAANAMTAKQIDGGLAAEVAMSLAGAIAVGFGTLFVATSRDRHGLLAAVSVVLGGLLLISTAAGRVSPQPKDLRLLPLATGAYVLYKLAGSVKHAFSIEQWRGFGMWIWILRFGGVLALTWFFSTFGAPRSW